jgi:hypothetical protein
MLRTSMAKAYIKRTIRPLYGWTQMTPKSVFLDPAWDRSVPIWPGMVFMRTSGENVSLINGTGVPYGLGALYVGGDGIDEPLDSGINAFAVWVLGPDAEVEILAPAFDTAAAWTTRATAPRPSSTPGPPARTEASWSRLAPLAPRRLPSPVCSRSTRPPRSPSAACAKARDSPLASKKENPACRSR